MLAVPGAARYAWRGLVTDGIVLDTEKEKDLLKGILKVGLIGCGSFVALLVLLVAGLLAWDYIDQKMAEREEKKAGSDTGSASAAGANPA